MLAIEESQKLTLSNLWVWATFTGTDQGQFSDEESEVLKQIGYDSADLNLPTLIWVVLQDVGAGVGQPSFLCGWRNRDIRPFCRYYNNQTLTQMMVRIHLRIPWQSFTNN